MTAVISPNNKFLGRISERTRLSRLVDSSAGGMICLVGPPGIGKTRLACAFAEQCRGRSYFCDLSGSRSVSNALGAIAASLGIPSQGIGDLQGFVDRIGAWLDGNGPQLVILDNAEQLLPAIAPVFAQWRRAGTWLLVTSRQALGIDEEHVVPVEPLALDSTAIDLFLERVPRHAVCSVSQSRDTQTLREIAVTLEGSPLAIELAAARLQIMSLDELRDRLSHRFAVLAAPHLSTRHSTLYAAIHWSWDLLGDWEKSALAQLSVCGGAFSLETAEGFLVLESPDPGHSGLDAVHSLVQKSLVQVINSPEGTRFKLLDSIRQFARQKVDGSGAARRLARCLLAGTEPLKTAASKGSVSAFQALCLDRDVLMSAMEACIELRDREAVVLALRLAGVLHAVWGGRDALHSHVENLDRVIAAVAGYDVPIVDELAVILQHRSVRLEWQGRYDLALADAERGLELARSMGDDSLAARFVGLMAGLASRRRDPEGAKKLAAECLALARSGSDRSVEALAILTTVSRSEEATRVPELRVALELAVGAKDDATAGVLCLELGDALADSIGDPEALALFDRAASLLSKEYAPRRNSRAIGNKGLALLLEYRCEEAEVCLETALQSMRVLDPQLAYAYSVFLGISQLAQGRIVDAKETLLAHGQHGGPVGPYCILRAVGCASCAVLLDDSDSAALQADSAVQRLKSAPHIASGSFAGLGVFAQTIADVVQCLLILEAGDRNAGSEVAAALGARVESWPITPDNRVAAMMISPAIDHLSRQADAWWFDSGGLWFEPPGGEPVDLTRRHALGRVVQALARARLETPGLALSSASLAAAGWPDEKSLPSSMANRLYVALSTLRKLGLDSLVKSPDGYRLDPDRPARLVDGP